MALKSFLEKNFTLMSLINVQSLVTIQVTKFSKIISVQVEKGLLNVLLLTIMTFF